MPTPIATAWIDFDPDNLPKPKPVYRPDRRPGREGKKKLSMRHGERILSPDTLLRFSPHRGWYQRGVPCNVAIKDIPGKQNKRIVFCSRITKAVTNCLLTDNRPADCTVLATYGPLTLVLLTEPREYRFRILQQRVLDALLKGKVTADQVGPDYDKLEKLIVLAMRSTGPESELAWWRAEAIASKLEKMTCEEEEE